MPDPLTAFALLSLLVWLTVLAAPWQAWSSRERLAAARRHGDLSDVSVLIPARNEAAVITRTLEALDQLDSNLDVIVVDDASEDDTAEAAARAMPRARIVRAAPRPEGWSGKLWALEQGRAHVERPLTLLLDADIELKPGIIDAMQSKLVDEERALVSLMASLRQESAWERLLVPAFIYFFKMLYPFRLSNARFPLVAAAAGGCILIKTNVIHELDLFASVRAELIDDCALARRVKSSGGRTWIGLSRDVVSHRAYDSLRPIWDMVTRSAYTQLKHSTMLLSACTAVMILMFWIPLMALTGDPSVWPGIAALAVMIATYIPTLRFYDRSPVAAALMPAVATLYLAMTWHSAINHWRGAGAQWKGRAYGRTGKVVLMGAPGSE